MVSKVAMAAAALIVVAALSGALDDSRFLDQDAELERVLSELCGLVENAYEACAEVVLTWRVPMMPTGAELRVTVDGSRILGETGGFRAVAQPMCELHTWELTADRLNRSIVEELDLSAPVVETSSGGVLTVTVAELMLDGAEEFMVFVLCDS